MAVTTIEKESYMLYRGWNPLFENLPKEQLGELFYAICCYQSGKEYEIKNPFVKGVFEMVLMQFQKDEASYKEKCEIKAKNGKKGAENRWQDNSKSQKDDSKCHSEDSKNGKSHSENGENGKCYFCHTEKKSEMAKMAIEEEDEEEDEDEDEVEEEEKDKKTKTVSHSSLRSECSVPETGFGDSENGRPDEKITVEREQTNYKAVVDSYNSLCKSFPKVTKLSERRRKAIRARLKEYSLAELEKAFALAEESEFLKGANNRNWMASFDWIISDSNLPKVLEGKYANRASPAGGKSKSMWGEDDYLAKLARGEVSLGEEDWFKSIKSPNIIDEKGDTA